MSRLWSCSRRRATGVKASWCTTLHEDSACPVAHACTVPQLQPKHPPPPRLHNLSICSPTYCSSTRTRTHEEHAVVH